ALYSGLALPVFYFMRIHTGLIRYSDTRDMLKIFSAMLATSVVYMAVAYLALVPLLGIQGRKLALVMLINFFIGTSFLVMLRITVKSFYFLLMRRARNLDTVRVLIYGADQHAIMAKQALENSTETKFIIVGFIDINRGKLNSYIERKRVYHVKDLAALKDKYAIDQMIFLKDHLGSRDKKVIVERCLRLGIKVLTVPPASEWVSGKLKLQQIKNLRIEDLLQRAPIKINNDKICD